MKTQHILDILERVEGLCGDDVGIVRYVEVPAGERTKGSPSAHAGG